MSRSVLKRVYTASGGFPKPKFSSFLFFFLTVSATFKTIKSIRKHSDTSVNVASRFASRGWTVCVQHPWHTPSVTTSAVSSRRRNDMEIIGTKSLPACHRMRSVLYIHMYWTQTCHRLWQPHSSHTKPILSAAQCLLSAPPPSPLLSDSIEMNTRTPGHILKWFVFLPPTEANFQRLINLGMIVAWVKRWLWSITTSNRKLSLKWVTLLFPI